MRTVLVIVMVAAALSAQTVSRQARAPSPDRVERLLRDLLIVDTHVDTPGYVVDEGYRLADEHDYYETDIPRLRRGHAGAIFFGVYVQPQDFPPDRWLSRAMEWIDAVYLEAARNPASLEIARTADDIERIHAAGRVAALLSLEGGHLIANSLPLLRTYYRLGIRYMTLTHFRANDWADSSTDQPWNNGLSPFGREVVGEMNRLGMMVDISHVSDKCFRDVLATSRAPIIASHSSLRALCDTPRNISDDMLRDLARHGGAVFINFNAPYLDPKAAAVFTHLREPRDQEIARMMAANASNPRRWEMKRAIQRRYREKLPKVSVNVLIDHIDHAVKIAGADHVGIGSDFDGISGMAPVGMEDVSRYPAIVAALVERGYSDADIRKIAGGNLLRVMRAVEAVSAR